MACQTCRSRKVKCDSARPRCRNCVQRSLNCTYEGERIKRRKLSDNGNHPVQRPATNGDICFQQMSRESVSVNLSRDSSSPLRHLPDANPKAPEQHGSYLSPASTNSYVHIEQPPVKDASQTKYRSHDLLDQILSHDPIPIPANSNPSVWIRTEVGDEYTGPSSGISAISDQGLNWIRRKVKGCGCLCNIFKQLRSTLLNHLRQPKCRGPGLWSNFQVHGPQRELPPWNTLEDYVEAYFSDVQVLFPVLDREKFQAQLALFKSGHNQDNPSWKALLFAVLASGCRPALSDETASGFQKSANEAWSYFVSALSYEPMLVHVATDLMAVQALAVMTVFAQGMSSPQRLEFTLCSTAVRLAFSLALNRAPPAQWDLTEGEKVERNRAFWVVYCLDKTLALRCGRPSGIDDADISCGFPQEATSILSPGTPFSSSDDERQPFDFFLCFTKFARICGRISRELYSAYALNQYCTDLRAQAAQLLTDLQAWRSTIPATKRIRQSFSSNKSPEDMSKAQLVVLQLSYYYAVCAVYRRFGPIFCQSDEDEDKVQTLLDGVITTSQIEAARSMVLLTKHIDVESYSPGWLVFYQPMTALITIFIHLIGNPNEKSAHHDIALMEVAVGFFGRLEYVTSGEAGFTQVTEFVRQARFIVDKSAHDPCRCISEDLNHTSSSSCSRSANETSMGLVNCPTATTDHSPERQSRDRLSGVVDDLPQFLQPNNPDVDLELLNSDGRKILPRKTGPAVLFERLSDSVSGNTELPHLGTTPYDPWLDAWLSPSELDLSALTQSY